MRFLILPVLRKENLNMYKFISVILFLSLLLTCLSGCSIINMGMNDKGDDGIGNNNNNIDNSHSNDKNDGAGNTDNTPNDTPTDDKKADSKEELDAAFEMIRSDAEAESKLKFSVEYEQDYYEIKRIRRCLLGCRFAGDLFKHR